MLYWSFICISVLLYIMGFIVNKQHNQIFSRSSLHIRWWFSSIALVLLGICIIDLIYGFQNIKMAGYSSISSFLFLIISWLTKRYN
ncbi:hypothetical protein J2S10_005089 [Neobacillus ginsengisoli]|uniref:Uncharacterized protein n=1 Tax=Neobacillus ginsengisoli TaxID=904295 RepID=A0ABT9Y237_9BACI|nr:hypothetical protein [Neobacillus ginsengisoli]